MSAFETAPVTSTYNYLRENAVKMGFNPNIQTSMAKILSMNSNGVIVEGYPILRCIDSERLCPCDEVRELGECDQGVFKKKIGVR